MQRVAEKWSKSMAEVVRAALELFTSSETDQYSMYATGADEDAEETL